MNDMRPEPAVRSSRPEPLDKLLTLGHVVYALHAFAVVSGVVGSATIVGSFLASVPSIVAVVLNYYKQSAVRGTWLESHFRWQIRTFWFALLWVLVGLALVLSVVGLIFGLAAFVATSFWIVYRIARGWWNLMHRCTMPMPRPLSG
jgi:uncharacterized membrane protein